MTAPGHTQTNLRWKRFSLVEQLANIGSEVERAVRARNPGTSPVSSGRWTVP